MTPMALCSADSFFRVYLAPLSLKLPVNCTKYKVGIEVIIGDVSLTRDTLGTARHQSLSIPGHTHLHVVLLEVHLEAEVAVHVGAVTRGDDDPVLDPVGSGGDVLELEQDRVVGVTPRVLGVNEGHLIALHVAQSIIRASTLRSSSSKSEETVAVRTRESLRSLSAVARSIAANVAN